MAHPSTCRFEPYRITVSDDTLSDLRTRLSMITWPRDVDEDETKYGTSVSYMRGLVDYWINDFDWAAAEASINEFTHHRVPVNGVPIHFLHEAGIGPAPVPLLLSHGWPWTFWDWQDVIGPLTDPGAYGGDPADAFELFVPSLPGYGFSSPTERFDLNFWKIADLLNGLMTDTLGFERYAAAGADYGAWVTGQIGHKYADNLTGIWIAHAIPLDNLLSQRPWDFTAGAMVPPETPSPLREHLLAYQKRYAGHVAAHVLDTQNLTFGLADSPLGMLSWILRRWETWADTSNGGLESVFSRDRMLTNATMWWATGTLTTAIRSYANIIHYPWAPSHDRRPIVEAPTGITFLDYDNATGTEADKRPQEFLDMPGSKEWFNPVYLKGHRHGGHFTPIENPEAVIEDIRATFRELRS